MGKPSGRDPGTTAIVAPATVVTATQAMAPAAAAAPATAAVPAAPRSVGARSVGSRPVGMPPAGEVPPASDGDHEPRSGPQRNRGLLVAIAVIAVAVVGVVIALAVTSLGDANSNATGSGGSPTASSSPTTAPAPSSTSTTLSPQALPQGQGLTALLAQSSGRRNQVQSATAAIASCGDLTGAQSILGGAQAARQSLLSQLGQLDLSALPQSAALTTALTNAWQSSAASDGSYAQWAADEQAKGCVANDSADPAYQAALVADGHASTAKQQFTSLWNPVATTLGLQQWQPGQL